MSNFMIRVTLPPRPWPFSWGPWGTSEETICREMDAGTVEIWQRDQKGCAGMVDEPMVITCHNDKRKCRTTVEYYNRSLTRRTLCPSGEEGR